MKSTRLAGLAYFLLIAAGSGCLAQPAVPTGAAAVVVPASAATPPWRDITPPPGTTPLHNPGMGLYLFGTIQESQVPPDAWYTQAIDIGYFREDWALLEPDREGDYQFDKFFGPVFDLWVKKLGKRVAFRFMSSNMHSRRKYVTPQWVFDAGVPSVLHKGVYLPEQVDPVFWDDRYLEIQERFIAALGKYLDGRPGVEFVDLGASASGAKCT